MSKQHEITVPTPLLRDDGLLTEPGYCKHNLFIYNRDKIIANKWRIKEWDFYQVSDGHYMVQLNFFDISLASALTAELRDLQTGKVIATSVSVQPLTPNRSIMSTNPEKPFYFDRKMMGNRCIFDVRENERRLYFSGRYGTKKFTIDLIAKKPADHESLTVATPFYKPGQYFYTTKINCMPTSGTVRLGGECVARFNEENTYTVLDWGRGTWPHSNMWYWGNGSTRLPDGKLFGFELTWGFGNESNATETAVFYDGKCHKLGRVNVETDPEIDGKWMQPWHFISEDGRFDMTMQPFYDNKNIVMPLDLVGMKTHQVHGLWSGKAVLDDGTVIEAKDMYAFCEKVYNKW